MIIVFSGHQGVENFLFLFFFSKYLSKWVSLYWNLFSESSLQINLRSVCLWTSYWYNFYYFVIFVVKYTKTKYTYVCSRFLRRISFVKNVFIKRRVVSIKYWYRNKNKFSDKFYIYKSTTINLKTLFTSSSNFLCLLVTSIQKASYKN